ncbi:MAG: hypothetical protein JXA22_02085 [Candidatus Thermoplasmatota archaeon]|nr:hypothetical protein [Candidatus Thermoplasmatota archaeon]
MSKTLLFATFMVITIMLSSALPVIFPAGAGPTRGEIAGVYEGEEIYRSSRALSGGMASGDPDQDGDTEIAFCDFDGNVILLEPRGDGGFDPIFIWQVEGPQGSNKTLFDLLIADVDPEKEGQEIITAGDAGIPLKEIYMIHYNGTAWVTEVIHRCQFRIFDLELGDIDPAPGMEILFGSFQHEEDLALHYLYRDGDLWKERSIPTTEAVKAITVADADPTVPGEEIWACIAGWNQFGGVESHLVEIYRSGASWVENIIYTHDTELISNVRIGELWSEHDVNEIIITELSGWCRLMYWKEGEFVMEDIFQADTISGQNSGLEGLSIGDFNPLHPGDEAVVTGYYNKVTQVIEVDGEIVADLAWMKDVEDPRLEIAGVEVTDVSEETPGNEVLIASLQGWIELLWFQDDGIGVGSDSTIIEVEDGGDKEMILEISPEGRFTGPVTVTASVPSGLTLTFDKDLELRFQESESLSVLIEAEEQGSERTSNVKFTVSGGGHSTEFDLTVRVVNFDIVQLVVTPQVGRIYQEGVNTCSASISLLGGQEYDYLDLAVATLVDGLAVNVDTPISPDEDNEITVSVVGKPSLGSNTITITGSYNGIIAAMGSFKVNVVALSAQLDASMRPVTGDINRYILNLNFTGWDPVQMVEIEMSIGERSLYKLTRDLQTGDSVVVPFSLEKGDDGDVVVTVRSISGDMIFQDDLGVVEYKEKDGGGLNIIEIAIIVVIVLIGLVLVYMVISWVSGKRTDGTEGGDIEAIYGTSPYGRSRRDTTSEGVRGGKLDRERRPPRRTEPPRDERRNTVRSTDPGPAPRGKEIRRAPPAPDHLRPGSGRGRDVRRAPPRRS